VTFLALAVLGCGGTLYQPGRGVVVHPDDRREIDDDDIRAAFAARPQMRVPSRIAWFNVAPEHDRAIEQMLSSIPAVAGTYQIPRLLVDGRQRFEPAHHGPQPAPTPAPSLERLRLVAARARCDVLVVFDYGYRVERSPNAWAAFNVLLVPALFVPFLDTEAESYLDAYVIDVRNGYLYGHASEILKDGEDEGTVWSEAETRLLDAQWSRLVQATGERLAIVLSEAGTTPEQPNEADDDDDDTVDPAAPDDDGDRLDGESTGRPVS
jgi:hypothetical protein